MAGDIVVVLSAYSQSKGMHNISIQPAAIWTVAVKESKMCLTSVVRFIPF